MAKPRSTASGNVLSSILADKSIKAKQKTQQIASLIQSSSVSIELVIDTAKTLKDSARASLIEAIEFVSKPNPFILNSECLDYISSCLAEKAPRVKWESARVIGNTIHLFPEKIKKILPLLLTNTEHEGTVVRWSAAYALAAVLGCKTPINKTLVPAIEIILVNETQNSIKKIYIQALKRLKQ